MALLVESESVAEGRPIPEEHAVAVPTPEGRSDIAGRNRSPHLRWSGEPDGTRSFAIAVVDPDAPGDASKMGAEGVVIGPDEPRVDFAHWLMADIPPDVHQVDEGADADGFVARGRPPGTTAGGIAGQNGYTGLFEGDEKLGGTYCGWDGPFPPWNDEQVHRYLFTVHALDVPSLGLEPGFTLEEFRTAIEGHVLADGTLAATYTLNPALR
jgi:Raf kinase inhibitor-like YbhB/YbcL family protein